jgi:hypothetical protein
LPSKENESAISSSPILKIESGVESKKGNSATLFSILNDFDFRAKHESQTRSRVSGELIGNLCEEQDLQNKCPQAKHRSEQLQRPKYLYNDVSAETQ